ncbi:MAG TPA: Holliday junction branch migration protein RuvA [Vicinamibacterales bacterium]|jgi:Holliday junction DNA helicase RuvA|nr:Holliday junction branch migration protein RuvA [Vicinamibacterales bacterium]
MIAALRGTLLEKHPNRVIVDVAGVGYDVQVPLSTFYGIGDAGGAVALRVRTHVREDAIALYGFLTALELELFDRLIAISGIGPKVALAVLSGIEAAELVRAVRTQDVARLTRIPGVGKKTAERIGLELKDKLPSEVQFPPSDDASGGDLRNDVISALVNLGYQRSAAEKAVGAELKKSADAGFEAVLRGALRAMMR